MNIGFGTSIRSRPFKMYGHGVLLEIPREITGGISEGSTTEITLIHKVFL